MEIVRIDEVIKMVGLSRTSIWRRIKDHDFPAPVLLGGPKTRAVGWRRADIEKWIANRQSVESKKRRGNLRGMARASVKRHKTPGAYNNRFLGLPNSTVRKTLRRTGSFTIDQRRGGSSRQSTRRSPSRIVYR